MLKVLVNGASGRVGMKLIEACLTEKDIELAGAVVSSNSRFLGTDTGECLGRAASSVLFSDQVPDSFDVAIDFSTPAAAMSIADRCQQIGSPALIATTGFETNQIEQLHQASRSIPICIAPNTSLAVNIGLNITQQIAETLGKVQAKPDVEIIERHHRYKVDSPSGTALKFGEVVAKPLGLDKPMHGRHGVVGQRNPNEIGYHAVRVGDDVGQHTVIFGMLGELLEMKVAATSREAYAVGAIAAAKFLVGKSPGLYSMNDVLGFES